MTVLLLLLLLLLFAKLLWPFVDAYLEAEVDERRSDIPVAPIKHTGVKLIFSLKTINTLLENSKFYTSMSVNVLLVLRRTTWSPMTLNYLQCYFNCSKSFSNQSVRNDFIIR